MTQLATFAAQEVDEDRVTPGVLGFIVFAAMAVAVWALMKSMNRHMGKVDFKESEEAGAPGASPESAASSGSKAKQQG